MKEEKRLRPVEMKWVLIKKALKDARDNDVKLINFSGGGEPTSHPKFLESIKLAKSFGLKVAVSTNGLVSLPILELIKNIDYYRLSFNCGTRETYKKLFGVDEFDSVIKRLINLISVKKSMKVKGVSDVGMAFLIVPENYKEVYRFCALASEIGVDFVHIRPAYLKDDKELRLILPEAFYYYEKAKEDFGKKLQIFFIEEKLEECWPLRNFKKCLSTPLMAILAADGKFILCPEVFEPRFGDYYKQDFWTIWNSDEHRKVIKQIDPDRCLRCCETKINEIIQKVFIEDLMRKDLL
jgi:MoaA/NifB/PqqE/SkfB family radical SAM enzyme